MEITEILASLVNIESITRNEKSVCDHIENLLNDTNGSLLREGDNLLWRSDDWQNGQETIALVGHIDTVPFNTEDWEVTKPTEAKEVDGKIYGRGACDMKGGDSIILDLILNQDLSSSPFNLCAIFYEGEEVGIPNGITKLLEKRLLKPPLDKEGVGGDLTVDLAIVLEPTDRQILYGVFTHCDIKVKASGKAAHSAQPDLGDNAIYRLNRYLQDVQSIALKKIDGLSEALSVTMIGGGNAPNIIPDQAWALVNLRVDPTLDTEAIIARFPKPPEGITLEVSNFTKGHIADPSKCQLINNLSQETGAPLYIVPFWTDTAQLGHHGIPAVNFGPGTIRECHIADEFVEIAELQWVRDQLLSFLTK